MQHVPMSELDKYREQVIKSFKEDEGSIMYMGSCDKYHYFKANVTRRTVRIKR